MPFYELEPWAVGASSVRDVVADGPVSRHELCTGRYAALCRTHGVR